MPRSVGEWRSSRSLSLGGGAAWELLLLAAGWVHKTSPGTQITLAIALAAVSERIDQESRCEPASLQSRRAPHPTSTTLTGGCCRAFRGCCPSASTARSVEPRPGITCTSSVRAIPTRGSAQVPAHVVWYRPRRGTSDRRACRARAPAGGLRGKLPANGAACHAVTNHCLSISDIGTNRTAAVERVAACFSSGARRGHASARGCRISGSRAQGGYITATVGHHDVGSGPGFLMYPTARGWRTRGMEAGLRARDPTELLLPQHTLKLGTY